MQFEPKTEAQLAEANLWPEGEYGFQVLDQITLGGNHYATCDRISKAGKEMIQLVVQLFNAEGTPRVIVDYLTAGMEFKLRHAAVACGLLHQYETGSLVASDFKGKQGFLKLKIGKASGEYPAKNEVKDYVVPEDDGASSFTPPPGHPAAASIDDEIKF